MKLEDFCIILQDNLDSLPSLESRLETAAKLICKAFAVSPDEVAIFSLDRDRESLSFLWPTELKKSGAVPLSAGNSLVVQTALANRGFLDNGFATTPHAAIFELFKGKTVDKPVPIQKIISVPFGQGGVVNGVIQLSRKGADRKSAGRDFTQNEVVALQRAGEIIARYVGAAVS